MGRKFHTFSDLISALDNESLTEDEDLNILDDEDLSTLQIPPAPPPQPPKLPPKRPSKRKPKK